jgi:hypothetical protein
MNNLIESEEMIDEFPNQLNDTEEANHKAYIGTQSVFLEK